MKITLYKCDHCRKILSDDVIRLPHISINLSEKSGWVEPNKNGWYNFSTKITGIKQFCSGRCLGKYFNERDDEKIKKNN